MNRLCTFLLLLVSCPCFAQNSITINAPAVDADTANQHLRIAPQPVAPPLARVVGTAVAVVLQIEISPEGRVVQVKTISGTPILQQPAIDAVKKWFYTPFERDGKPAAVSTMVTFPFVQRRGDPNDALIAQTFAPLDKKCVDAINKQAPPAEQADACRKAAEVAQDFSSRGHFVERRQAYIYYVTTLLRNQQTKEALPWAEKAVAEVLEDRDDSAGASAAYSVRAQVRALSGDLAGSDQDLTAAEDFERQALAISDSKSHASYVGGLKVLLNFHAQVLKAMKRPADAQSKLDEAAKL